MVHVILGTSFRSLGDRRCSLTFGPHKEDATASCNGFADDIEGRIEKRDGLRQVDDVNSVALTKDELAHARVPALLLMAKMNARFKKLTHGKLWKSHFRFLSGLCLGTGREALLQPVDARGCIPRMPARACDVKCCAYNLSLRPLQPFCRDREAAVTPTMKPHCGRRGMTLHMRLGSPADGNDMSLEPSRKSARKSGLFSGLRGSFLTGLVVIAPVGLTVWLMWTVIGWVDGFVLPLIPERYQPEQYIGINLRGIGVIIFLVFTIIVGWVAKGLIGRSLIKFAESIVHRMPVVRSIYSGVKQIAETVFAQSERSFEKACIVEYPRKGIWAIGFIATEARGEVNARIPSESEILTVFVPTTPNPTSGFLLYFPREDVIELAMSIEDAAKLVISAGLVYPNQEKVLASIDEENPKPGPSRP